MCNGVPVDPKHLLLREEKNGTSDADLPYLSCILMNFLKATINRIHDSYP